MPRCDGNTEDHCCYINGQPCLYLEVDTLPDRHWVCGLRRELGAWDAVHTDARYLQNVAPVVRPLGADCGDWPPPEHPCPICGK